MGCLIGVLNLRGERAECPDEAKNCAVSGRISRENGSPRGCDVVNQEAKKEVLSEVVQVF